jgi:hypothetical protein
LFPSKPLLSSLCKTVTTQLRVFLFWFLGVFSFLFARATMATPKQHIEHIRKTTFSIGGEKNPLAPMLDQAVKYLSAELYAKDVHFLMELIQVFFLFYQCDQTMLFSMFNVACFTLYVLFALDPFFLF